MSTKRPHDDEQSDSPVQMEHYLREEVQQLRREMQQVVQTQNASWNDLQQMLVQMQEMLVQMQPSPAPAGQPEVVPPPAGPPPRVRVNSLVDNQAIEVYRAAAAMVVYGRQQPGGQQQCIFHTQHVSRNTMTVDISGGRPVTDVWQFDDEFKSMRHHLFGSDDRGADELCARLRSDFVQGKVRIVCARSSSGANRMWFCECTCCTQFNHVEYGTWACWTPESKAAKRQQMFNWHNPPIKSAPMIAPGDTLPAGRPTV